MNKLAQVEFEPIGIVGAIVGGIAAFLIQRTAGVGWLWNIIAFIGGAFLGYIATVKIVGN